ncbi:hypothetical protein AMTRI_Chr02g258550 [Amborella trichopoda]
MFLFALCPPIGRSLHSSLHSYRSLSMFLSTPPIGHSLCSSLPLPFGHSLCSSVLSHRSLYMFRSAPFYVIVMISIFNVIVMLVVVVPFLCHCYVSSGCSCMQNLLTIGVGSWPRSVPQAGRYKAHNV